MLASVALPLTLRPAASPFETSALLHPLFQPDERMRQLGADMLDLVKLLEGVPRRFFGADIRRYLATQHQPPERAELIYRGSGDGTVVPYGRVDAVLSGQEFKVIEFNLASDLGGVDAAKLNRAQLTRPALKQFADRHELAFEDTAGHLARLLREQARSALGTDDPLVGLIEETGSGRTCISTAIALKQHGLRVVLGEFGDLSSDNGKIILNGRHRLDVIVRYFFVDHLPHEKDALQRIELLARAHREHKTVLFTPLDSESLGNKAAFGLLFQDEIWTRLSEHERSLLKRRIPWTRLIGAAKGTARRELVDECAARQDELLIKPAFGNNSTGVLVGARTGKADWLDALRSPQAERYVVQQFVKSDVSRLVSANSGQVEEWDVIWGIFISPYGYGGAYSRALPSGASEVIGGSPDTRFGSVFTY